MASVLVPVDLWDDDSPGVISTWLFEDGDQVSEGDVVAEIMNEKISFDVPAPATGILTISAQAESEVTQGQTIGEIAA